MGYDPRLRDRAPVHFGLMVGQLTGAAVVVACVEVGPRGWTSQPDADLVGDCSDDLARLEAELAPSPGAVEFRKLRGVSAARALHEEADREAAALIVVGSSRRSSIGRVLAGSTALRLLHGSSSPVAVVPQGWEQDHRFGTVGVGYVETDEGRAALQVARALARRLGASLRLITAVKHTEVMHLDVETYAEGTFGKSLEDVEGEYRLEAERRLRQLAAELGDEVPIEIDATVGDPAEVLIAVSVHLDLLVCGSRAYGPLRAVLLGSVTRRLIDEARCPVLVLPRGVRSPLDSLLGEQVDERAAATY